MGMFGDLELTKNSGNARPGGLGGAWPGQGFNGLVSAAGTRWGKPGDKGAFWSYQAPPRLRPLQKVPSQAKSSPISPNPRHVVCEEKHGTFSEARAATHPSDSSLGKATARARNPTIASGWQAHYIDGDVITRPVVRGPRRAAARDLSVDRRTRHHRLLWRSFAILCRRGSHARPPGAPGWLPARMEAPTPCRGCAR